MTISSIRTAGLRLFALTAAALPALAQSLPTTRTKQGAVQGIREGAVAAYLGIPFAAPPVGALRWREPVAPRILALGSSSAARPLLDARKLSLFERYIQSGGMPGLF